MKFQCSHSIIWKNSTASLREPSSKNIYVRYFPITYEPNERTEIRHIDNKNGFDIIFLFLHMFLVQI